MASVAGLLRAGTVGGIVLCTFGLGLLQPGDPAERDDAFALRYLLGQKTARYWVTRPGAERYYDSLAEYQAWSQLYSRSRTAADRDGDDRSLRLYLFMALVAQSKNDAALSEALSADLYPIFSRRHPAVLQLLDELPFLVRPACHYLGAYHGFEGRNAEARASAMAETARLVSQALSGPNAAACLAELRR